MQIKVEQKGKTIISVEGRLDSSNSGELEKVLLECQAAGKNDLLIDFSRLDYISSAGLRVLLMTAKSAKAAGGQVVLAALNSDVRQVFDISGFTSIFPIIEKDDC